MNDGGRGLGEELRASEGTAVTAVTAPLESHGG